MAQRTRRKPRAYRPLERDIQRAILEALRFHPSVAWAYRMNTGGATYRNEDTAQRPRFVRYGVPGQSDISGQLRDGRRLEIEVKRPGEDPTEIQDAFLTTVRDNNGVAGCAHSVEEALAIVDGAGVIR